MKNDWKRYHPPKDLAAVLQGNHDVQIISTSQELVDLACGGPESSVFEVAYHISGYGKMVECAAGTPTRW